MSTAMIRSQETSRSLATGLELNGDLNRLVNLQYETIVGGSRMMAGEIPAAEGFDVRVSPAGYIDVVIQRTGCPGPLTIRLHDHQAAELIESLGDARSQLAIQNE